MLYLSFRIVANVLAWLGLLAVFAVGLALIIGPTWCSGDTCTVQGWFAALSGWAAAVAATATIGILYRQARAGDDALEHARETAKRQLRAYVFINQMELKSPDLQVFLRFKNTGQTPAYKVRIAVQQIAAPPEQIVFADPIESRAAFDLGPADTQTTIVGFGTFAAHVPALHSGTSVAFINGLVLYEDAFGIERTTHFRLKVPRTVWLTGGTLDAALDGNWSN